MTKITGYEESEALGKNIIDGFIKPKNRDEVRAVLEHTLKTGEGKYRYEFPLFSKTGRKRVIWLSAS